MYKLLFEALKKLFLLIQCDILVIASVDPTIFGFLDPFPDPFREIERIHNTDIKSNRITGDTIG